jgi:hypothetical protein
VGHFAVEQRSHAPERTPAFPLWEIISMAYEVRIDRQTIAVYPTTEEAMWRVREVMRRISLDCEVELIDTRTGGAAEPGSTISSRAELATMIGF